MRIAVVMTAALAAGCTYEGLGGTLIEDEWTVAALNDTTYTVNVWLPESIDTQDNVPWLLMMDADVSFFSDALATQAAINAGETTPFVLVGIGNQDTRAQDYTPLPQAWEAPNDGWQNVGGIHAFTAFLTTEFVPHMEETYDLGGSPDLRGFTGHSYGGLATTYMLFHHTDTWTRFAATSPALWWDQGIPFEWERAHAAAQDDLDATVYLSMGSVEAPSMNALFRQFTDDLQTRAYPGLELTAREWYGLEHYSSYEPAFDGAIRTMFPGGGR